MTECVTPAVSAASASPPKDPSDVSVQVRRGPFPVAERLPGKRRCSKSIGEPEESTTRASHGATRAGP